MNTDEILQLALSAHQEGQLDRARDLYWQILKKNPHDSDVLFLLGTLYLQCSDLKSACELFEKVIQTKPDFYEAHNNLGTCCLRLGKPDEALLHFKNALDLKPALPTAYLNVALVLKDLGKTEEAIGHYLKSLQFKPDDAQTFFLLGNAYESIQKWEMALESYKNAIGFNENYFQAYAGAGLALKNLGHTLDAIESFKKSLSLAPDNLGALVNLGDCLMMEGFMDDAIALFEKVLSKNPSHKEALNNLGNAYNEKGLYGKAECTFKKLIALYPTLPEAHNNCATSILRQGRSQEAYAEINLALKLNPHSVDFQDNYLCLITYLSSVKPDWVASEHRRIGQERFDSIDKKNVFKHTSKINAANRKIKIGLVSADFREHSCSYFMSPFFEGLDRNKFEIFAYSNTKHTDKITADLKNKATAWRDIVPLNALQAARQIHDDKIDILFDLSGHTGDNRLGVFLYKPAPVQMTAIGYPNITGLPTMDYRLVDSITDPETELQKTDTFSRIEPSFLCYKPSDNLPPIGNCPHLKNGYITFGSFNNIAKTTPEVLQTWRQLLKELPSSRLLLKSKSFNEEDVRNYFEKHFTQAGIEKERITLMPFSPAREHHLSLYDKIDIALDPFPWNGTTTTFESFVMGVPVITFSGTTHASRVGASLCKAMQLDKWIATNQNDYVQKAVHFASQSDLLVQMRASLRKQLLESPLCDLKSYSSRLESLLLQIINNT